jgi:hypothetical protein
MRRSWLLVSLAFAATSSGCLFGPSIECDLSADLTQADCDHAAQAALAKLTSGGAVTRVVVHPGCPGYWRCLAINRRVIGVEVSFAHTTTQALFAVDRETWDSGPPNFTSPAPLGP